MSFIDRFLAILTPYECLGCAADGDLLCAGCIQQLTAVPERCYRCLQTSADCLTCTECTVVSSLVRVQPGAIYKGSAKELVVRLKFSGAQAAARPMAARLLPLLPAGKQVLVMPLPTATSRVRGRGYDQAKLLARELSRQARLPYADYLVRSGQTHQVGASREQRQQQLRVAFRVTSPGRVRGRNILLVDDVVTTGATLETAARILHEGGAARIEAVAFCAA